MNLTLRYAMARFGHHDRPDFSKSSPTNAIGPILFGCTRAAKSSQFSNRHGQILSGNWNCRRTARRERQTRNPLFSNILRRSCLVNPVEFLFNSRLRGLCVPYGSTPLPWGAPALWFNSVSSPIHSRSLASIRGPVSSFPGFPLAPSGIIVFPVSSIPHTPYIPYTSRFSRCFSPHFWPFAPLFSCPHPPKARP